MVPAKDVFAEKIRLLRRSGKLAPRIAALAVALDRDRPAYVLLLTSFLIGAAYCSWIFDIGFLTGRSGFWINSRGISGIVGADISTALSGYYFFVSGHWHLPLFRVDRLGIPQGIAIIFTDSVPVIALIGRLIYRLTGGVFNLFGWWTASCFILLGMSLTGLVAILGQRSVLSAVAATIIALCMPPLLWRWGQPALMAHFEIALALIYYFACKKQLHPVPFRFAVAALQLVLALWTNPYIFLAVGGVVFAAIGQALLDRRLALRAGCAMLVGLLVVVATVMLVSGYLEPPGSVAGAGFGHYSMNLLSPISPQMSGLVPSRRSFVLDGTGGQYEGFNYFGGGVLLLIVLAARSTERSSLKALRQWAQRITKSWRNHACLWSVLLGFTAFAVSNTVFVGGWNVAVLPLPSWLLQILSIFRSSGRLFWPVLYAITAIALVAAASRRRRIKAAVLLLACLLQWLDTVPLREAVAASAAASVPPLIDGPAWRQAIARHRSIRIFPPFACLDQPPYTWTWSRQVAIQLQLFAGLEGVATNTVYAGRGSGDCLSEARSAAAFSRPAPGELAVFFSEYPGFAELRASAGEGNGPCRATARLAVCSEDFRHFNPQSLLAASSAE